MKLNEDKCHLLISGHKFEHVWADIGNARLWESQRQKLLGVTIDKNLKFNNHISDICMKAGRKLTALGRLSRLLPFNPIRRGLLWSGVEAGGGGGGGRIPPPLFYSLTTYANEIKFGTVIVHYIINNLVKKNGLSRVNFC